MLSRTGGLVTTSGERELARLGRQGSARDQVRTAVRLLDAYGWEAVDVEAVLAAIATVFADDLSFCLGQARAGNPFYLEWARSGGPAPLRERADRAAALVPRLRSAALRAVAPVRSEER